MAKVNRDEILEAAIHLFNQSGYHATSMQDIARAVCIKKPSLYHHFDSKEAILLTILNIGMEQLTAEVNAVAASDMPIADKLRAAIRAHALMIAGNLEGAAVFLREDRGLGDSYLAEYVSRRDDFERVLRQIVQQGVDEGVFRETDTAISVQALLGMVNWMTRWYRPEGRLTAQSIADQFADLFLGGLLKQPST
jgi:AcrR family transcriptional regulator